MLAYAANAPRTAGRARSPRALTLIVAGHAALIAAVMTARMEVIGPIVDEIPDIINIKPETPPPPPPPPAPEIDRPTHPATQDLFIQSERPIVDMDQGPPFELDTGPRIRDIGDVIGSGPTTIIDPPRHVPVKLAAVPRTPEGALRPPYPNDKLRLEEEATLRLRLTIDVRGRVTAVEPVGPADPSFLEAARRHILRAWRYKPATEDGVPVPSTMTINLSFRLEEA
ncbi:MAG: energy transducer TonB [Sphingomicrobium sp.]